MEQFHVMIEQGDNKVHFAFNEFDDAREFVLICMETADKGTKVIFYEDKDE